MSTSSSHSMPEKRAAIISKCDELSQALEAHPLWTSPKPHPTLYFVWDFIHRSSYMLSEYEAIVEGKALKHPDQFRPAPGKGEKAAEEVYQDVHGRCFFTNILVTDTSGKTAAMTGQTAGQEVDFGEDIKRIAGELGDL